MSIDTPLPDATHLSWAHYYEGRVTWRSFRYNLTGHLPFFRRVLWPRPHMALEVGTGTATMTALVGYCGVRTTSLDLQRPILERGRDTLRRFHSGAGLVQGDAFNLPFADAAYDVAFSQGFFEHFEDADIEKLLREQARVARRVVFSVPNAAYGVQDFGNERLLSKRQWDEMISRAGLRMVESQDYAPIRRHRRDRVAVHYLAVVTSH
jgi:ubiquinone/menaquinone biosynthesis C-methylase UbiE